MNTTGPTPTRQAPRLTQILQDEHERIARALGCLARLAEHLRVSSDVHPDAVRALLEFLRERADHEHHQKEEELLFPWMARHGMPADTGPLAMMQAEHEEGRDHVRHLLAAARHVQTVAEVRREFVERAEALCRLLYAHIDKENHILFPLAERMAEGTRELVRQGFDAEGWDAALAPLEREAQSWPAARILPRPGCCHNCG